MGLGKTIQVVVFIAGLHYSKRLEGPTLVVCPATMLRQWIQEFHTWYPILSVSMLHQSGTWKGDPSDLIRRVGRSKHDVLVTTYEQIRIHHQMLKRMPWEYIFCDEGHKLRNPDANITILCKQFSTPHRFIITGAPIQNNLTELWSLFDFVFPGKLGTLPTFQKQFSEPISRGGYSTATSIEVHTAFQCALILRDLINPYLLRRLKKDVKVILPAKREQVLFCPLTEAQRKAYLDFTSSRDFTATLRGSKNSLAAIDYLRKICNHPILVTKEKRATIYDLTREDLLRSSAKLRVLDNILPLWKQQKHRLLIFCQTKQMLDVVERFVAISPYELTYERMDGSTPVSTRQSLINKFNSPDGPFIFLLTTKTGGLGVNLTGADRIIIFDPDWNPSTDIQARERSWRIGQKKQVTIYRLITTGTIEEKIYHRQIYKNFLTTKVLKDPRQSKTFFKSKDLKALLSLDESSTIESISHSSEDINGTSKEVGGGSGGQTKRSYHQTDLSNHDDDATSNPEVTSEPPNKKMKTGIKRYGKVVDEDGLLKSLMGEGLSTMIDHDKVEGWKPSASSSSSSTKIGQVYNMYDVEKQAERIASKAAEALRLERLQVQSLGVSVPTWTGKRGSAGAPAPASTPSTPTTPKPRFGTMSRANTPSPMSKQIHNPFLQRSDPKNLNSTSISTSTTHTSTPSTSPTSTSTVSEKTLPTPNKSKPLSKAPTPSSKKNTLEDDLFFSPSPTPSKKSSTTTTNTTSSSSQQLISNIEKEMTGMDNFKLVKEMHEFFLKNNRTVSSQQIIEHFKPQIPQDGAIIFKKMLQKIAKFIKKQNVWVLNDL
eukprot:TRINITY_DN1788_c5_g1_i1.p1 TRINITY_DN1788_c5_g1~~TRINITY_DN1788_c5_g1_i1.p1  ORF type:complete len:913 (-),score=231.73 TRINITY_DN1788_c5_g1_i1:191-2668(-)